MDKDSNDNDDADGHGVLPHSQRCWSFIPEALLLLAHVVRELVALASRLDAAPVAGRRLCAVLVQRVGHLALAELQLARIPTDAELELARARRPQTGNISTARRRSRKCGHRRIQLGLRSACKKIK